MRDSRMEAGLPIKILDWATLRVHKSANRAFLQSSSVQLQLNSAVFCCTLRSSLGLSTCCSRFSKGHSRNFSKLKVLESSLKNNQKLLFVTKVSQTFSIKQNPFFGLMLKDANCTTKVGFLSIFVQFYGVTNVALVLAPFFVTGNS